MCIIYISTINPSATKTQRPNYCSGKFSIQDMFLRDSQKCKNALLQRTMHIIYYTLYIIHHSLAAHLLDLLSTLLRELRVYSVTLCFVCICTLHYIDSIVFAYLCIFRVHASYTHNWHYIHPPPAESVFGDSEAHCIHERTSCRLTPAYNTLYTSFHTQ